MQDARELLIRQKTATLFKLFSGDKDYTKYKQRNTKSIVRANNRRIENNTPGKENNNLLWLARIFHDQAVQENRITRFLNNPKTLEKMLEIYADKYYMTTEELSKRLDNFYHFYYRQGIDRREMYEVEELVQATLPFTQNNQQLIEGLDKISDSIQLTRRAQHILIRKQFPKAEIYLQHIQYGMKSMNELFSKFNQQLPFSSIKAAKYTQDNLKQRERELVRNHLEKEIKRIYDTHIQITFPHEVLQQ